MDNIEKLKTIIEKIIYITVATISEDGNPWNTPVYSAYDEAFNFFWASWKECEHSKNIRHNENIFFVIYDSTAPEGTGEGVYVSARAYELNDPKEIEHAIKYLYGRKHKTPRKPEEFMGNFPRRIYKAVPEKFWINLDSEVKGNFVDTRVEVNV